MTEPRGVSKYDGRLVRENRTTRCSGVTPGTIFYLRIRRATIWARIRPICRARQVSLGRLSVFFCPIAFGPRPSGIHHATHRPGPVYLFAGGRTARGGMDGEG